ncbi:MAG TPA: carbohydrate porin [Candidatus Binatia bacterium]|jgi:porin
MNPLRIILGITAMLAVAVGARADDAAPDKSYSGSPFERTTLTGDWGGLRNELATKGVTLDATVTQVTSGVVDGGKDHTWQYGGRAELSTTIDSQKLGLWPGGFLLIELEGNWDRATGFRDTGALMPVNSNQLYPIPSGSNFNVPAVTFAQFLSHYVGVTFGKFDTLSGDDNEFAHGKGDTQFLNLAFNVNPTLLLAAPYSTLGAGVIVLPTKDPQAAIVNFTVLQANGNASEAGFDDLTTDKLTFAGEGRVRTGFFGLTGHQLVGGAYSNRNFTSLDQRIGAVLDKNLIVKQTDTWAVYYNFDQYFYEPKKGSGQGAGVFARLGFSDGNPNPMEDFVSLGIGGKGVFESRANDGFGLGFYWIDVKTPTLQTPLQDLSFLQDEWGFEAYYAAAVTPWLVLTPDLQVVEPAQKKQVLGLLDQPSVHTDVIVGLRMHVIF